MTNAQPLFPGDTGTLSLETRRVLVNLLRGPMLDGQRQSLLWATLLRDADLIRGYLHNLFLTLVLDVERQVAFVQQAEAEGLDIPTLLRKTTLTFRESALLLHLRGELAISDAQGERCVVDREALIEHLKAYTQADDNDSVKFDKQSEAAIEKLIKLSLLHKLKGTESRLEVSQALRLMFSIAEIESLTSVFTALQSGAAVSELAPGLTLDLIARSEAADEAQEQETF